MSCQRRQWQACRLLRRQRAGLAHGGCKADGPVSAPRASDAFYYACLLIMPAFWRHSEGNTIKIVTFSADKVEGRRAPGAKPELALSFGGDDGWRRNLRPGPSFGE
jgi:hypothetical protein